MPCFFFFFFQFFCFKCKIRKLYNSSFNVILCKVHYLSQTIWRRVGITQQHRSQVSPYCGTAQCLVNILIRTNYSAKQTVYFRRVDEMTYFEEKNNYSCLILCYIHVQHRMEKRHNSVFRLDSLTNWIIFLLGEGKKNLRTLKKQ